MYYIALFFVNLISKLPFCVLYIISDFLYLIVYYVVGYRKEVVRLNLQNSFPEKTSEERKKIERDFYRHFCDLILEGIKLQSISRKEMALRMKYIDYEPAIAHYAEGRSVMLLTSHFGNWEWLSSFSMHLPKDKPVYQVYKQQKDHVADRIVDKLRRRFGAENIEMSSFYRSLIQMKREGRLGMFGMLSDQSPRLNSIHYWTELLNQETAMIDGTEQIARKFNYPVYYCDVKKIKRGYYTCTLSPIATEPKETSEHEITEKYARLLEQTIEEQPPFWLWSHKRWKHKKSEIV
ncbi:MAG: lysophospholipid acyltransferase family protein [Bacteroidales bacterium]|nr:lysophospholipid acyltransferase family protein [Bacteroidales bacterium]